MLWQNHFTLSILMRGNDYFKRGKVVGLTPMGDVYLAKVIGSRTYTVSIQEKDGALYHATCDCPHSRSGYFCKHIAAVLFAIENYENIQSDKEMESSPFDAFCQPEGEGEDGYRYFDMRRIARNVIIYEETYNRARLLLENGRIADVALRYSCREDGGMICEAQGQYKGNIDCLLSVTFDRRGIINSFSEKYVSGFGSAGMIHHGDRIEPNQYILALLLEAGRRLADDPNAGDSTSGAGMKLLNAFRSERVSGSLTELRRKIELEPRFVRENGRYYMTLRAGVDKLLVVKNITELVNAAEENSEYESGKLSFVFPRDRFSEKSLPLYGFLKDVVDDVKLRSDIARNSYYGYSSPSEAVKNRIELYGSRLDGFFDALTEGKITQVFFTDVTNTGKVNSQLYPGTSVPEITLDISCDVDEDKIFHGIKAVGHAPIFIKGSEHRYFIEGDRFCRVDPETDRKLEPLYMLLGKGEFSFNVGRNNMAEFCYSVLPMLRGIINVREHDGEKIAEYLPPEAEPVFYLDNDNGLLTCRAVARYGDTEFPLADSLPGGVLHSAHRDIRRESETLEVVMEYFPDYRPERDLFVCESDDDAAYRVLAEGVGELLRVGEVNCTDSFKALTIRRRLPVRMGVSLSGDLMNLTIESDDVSIKELAEILKSYRRKKRYHRLKNGEFVDIDETIAELSEMAETMRLSPADLAKGSVNLPVYRALYLDKMSEKCDALRVKRDSYFKKLIKEFKTVSDSDFEAPEHLQGIMRNYQVYGYRWLRTLEKYGFGGILADDMGLGKTLQVISVLSAAKSEGDAGTSLVVCPASLIYNWLEELARFSPELNAVAIAGHQSERAEIIGRIRQYDVAVTSYDLLKRDISFYENIQFNYEIIDEAQYIKNHSTAAAKSVKVITARVRFALTGTPIENRLSELWSIFDYLMPGFLYGYETFRKELEAPIAKKGDPIATEKLKRMTSPFILRRLKGDVLKDLPDKMEEVRYAAFDTEQRRIYDAQVAHMKGMLENTDQNTLSKSKIQILAELTRIRQICCDPSLLFEDYRGGSAKRLACMELVKSAIEGEHKILLFSQFTSMLELLESDLSAEGISYYKIVGATPKQERVELVQKFNTDDTSVFLISLKAGGTGLNLTGADVVIHYDPWWNVAAQNQATDRAHRIGQTKIVSVYRIIVKHSVEEKILELQESKKDLADEILSGELGGIGSMTRDELLSLLEE
ncbi:MAG: SNF2 helicase associated domain-containing protein [Clostridia bacterium]|nr:SNF2 helicase associated domain-containing protein [Clostridia bacterium]